MNIKEENSGLSLRMYGFVNYQLVGIQSGIQFAHACVDYGLNYNSDLYLDWARNHKTVIVLDGGSTNTNPERLGTMNQFLLDLLYMNVITQPFYEPDLGDQLTAFAFLVDERVFDKAKYPNFIFTDKQLDETNPIFSDDYEEVKWHEWIDNIGGNQNLKLRYFLSGKKLAN